MITVDAKAAERVRGLLGKAGKPNIRIRVTSGGCSGLEYAIEPADAAGPGDVAFGQDGFQVLVDRQSLLYIAGSELTLESSLMKTAFRLKNPNATGSCSCGESFTV